MSANPDIVGSRGLPQIITTVNALIEKDLTSDQYNDPQYSYRVFVVPRTINNRNKADQAVTYAPSGSDVEMAVREVERPKYRPADIVSTMQSEGFINFAIHGKNGFVSIWQKLDGKNPDKGYGVDVAGAWVWYEKMVDAVRSELTRRAAIPA